MAGLVFDPKNFKKNKWNDPFSPYLKPVMEFARDTVKDAGISVAQIANEGANNGLLFTGGPFLKAFLGNDYLARYAGKLSPELGKTMTGEVTPMDVVNLASVLPIPVGAGAKAGLIGLKLAAKAQRGLGRSAFKLGASPSKHIYEPSIAARIAENTMHNPITANFLNNAPELALNSPALIDTWKSDLSTEEKVGLTAAILAGTSARGIKDLAKYKIGNRRARNSVEYGSALVRTEARGSSATSDIAMAMDTDMPVEALVAFTGGQSGYRTKWYATLYEHDPVFRSTVDDFNAGAIDIATAINRTRGVGLMPSNWRAWQRKKNTGSFVKNPLNPKTQKLDTLYDTITFNPRRGTVPWDTKEQGRAENLIKTGELRGVKGRGGARQQAYLDWYFNNVLRSNNPFVAQARRERLYGESGVSDRNVY